MTDAATDPRIERTRTAVLDAGVAILFEQGPDGVTHAAVATAAPVSRTTLYKHWPTRADLLFDILNCVEPHKNVEPTGEIRSDLFEMMGEMAIAFADPQLNKMFSSLMAQAQWDDDTDKAQQALLAGGMANMERVLDAAVANNQLPAGIDPLRAGGRLVGPMFFASLIGRRPMLPAEVEQLVDDWLATHQI